jgi:hypothetical protein
MDWQKLLENKHMNMLAWNRKLNNLNLFFISKHCRLPLFLPVFKAALKIIFARSFQVRITLIMPAQFLLLAKPIVRIVRWHQISS